MVYNLSLINSTGFSSLAQTVNENLMFGWYGVGILITLTVIMFISFNTYRDETKRNLAISLFFASVFSLFMRAWSLVSDVHVLVFWILTAIMGAIIYFSE